MVSSLVVELRLATRLRVERERLGASSIVGRVAGYRAPEFALLKACARFVEATVDPALPELRAGRTNREGLGKKTVVAVVALVVIAAVLIYALAA
jgi:hypothetical protein